jgi:hypothetical protein
MLGAPQLKLAEPVTVTPPKLPLELATDEFATDELEIVAGAEEDEYIDEDDELELLMLTLELLLELLLTLLEDAFDLLVP